MYFLIKGLFACYSLEETLFYDATLKQMKITVLLKDCTKSVIELIRNLSEYWALIELMTFITKEIDL